MKSILSLIFVILFTGQLNVTAQENDQSNENCKIDGVIVDAATQNPLPGVTVRLLETKLGAFTNAEGKFEIKNVPSGVYSIKFSSVGYQTYVEANVAFNCGRPLTLEIELLQRVIELEGAEVKGSYFVKRIETVTSTQNLSSEDIRRAPGVQEDVVRATALLPGVATTAAGRNDLLVRGGAPFENLFIVDGIEIPNINHFGSQGASGGPLSIINIDFVRDVDFSSGGFGAKYGDKVSSITNITLRNGNDQRFGGEANLSATGFGLILEGPIGGSGSYFFSARRSYLDFIFKAAGFGFIPEYWDFQGKVNYKIDNKNSLSFLAIGALDDVTLNNDDLDNRYENSRFAVPEQKQYFSGLTWKTLFGNGFATFTLGRTYTYFNTFQNDSLLNPIFKNKSYEGENSFKAEFDFQLDKGTELIFGNQIKYASKLDYDVLVPGDLRKDQNGTPQPLETDTSISVFKNATFASLSTYLGRHKITFGSRMSYFSHLSPELYFSPRLSVIYTINAVSSIIFSGGRYYQSPSYIWLIGGSEKTLKPIRADQVVLGYEHTPLKDVKVQLEGYYKWYANYPARVYRPQAVLAPSGFDDLTTDIPFGLEPILPEAEGWSRGVELFIQKKLSDIPIYGLFSLTLAQTKFTSLDGIERTGAFDTRFILNITGGWRPGNDWEIAAKFRASTGRPTTPFKDDNSGELDFDRYNEGERFPFFHQLDLRVDKRWDIGRFGLVTYIDIQNIYNRKNLQEVKWNYRTQSPQYDEPIGLLPSIGIIFEF